MNAKKNHVNKATALGSEIPGDLGVEPGKSRIWEKAVPQWGKVPQSPPHPSCHFHQGIISVVWGSVIVPRDLQATPGNWQLCTNSPMQKNHPCIN